VIDNTHAMHYQQTLYKKKWANDRYISDTQSKCDLYDYIAQKKAYILTLQEDTYTDMHSDCDPETLRHNFLHAI